MTALSVFSSSVRGTVLAVLLLGLAWPLATTLGLGVVFPHQAAGSPVVVDGRVVGSALVGQAFTGPGWLHGRPSAAGYDPRAAAGSNLAASNPALRERVATAAAELGPLPPPEAVTASGSGLDPHVSPAHAELQVARIAVARGLPEVEVRELVARHTERGPLGPPRVNVLAVNVALATLGSEAK